MDVIPSTECRNCGAFACTIPTDPWYVGNAEAMPDLVRRRVYSPPDGPSGPIFAWTAAATQQWFVALGLPILGDRLRRQRVTGATLTTFTHEMFLANGVRDINIRGHLLVMILDLIEVGIDPIPG